MFYKKYLDPDYHNYQEDQNNLIISDTPCIVYLMPSLFLNKTT